MKTDFRAGISDTNRLQSWYICSHTKTDFRVNISVDTQRQTSELTFFNTIDRLCRIWMTDFIVGI